MAICVNLTDSGIENSPAPESRNADHLTAFKKIVFAVPKKVLLQSKLSTYKIIFSIIDFATFNCSLLKCRIA